MLHTHDGARVAMMCLLHGTAKDRKIIIKSFKTFVVKISKEEFGHMVLLALLDVVDDTKIVNKAILDELLKSLDDVSSDKYGRKVLFYLLLPRDPLHFHPDIITVLQQGDTNRHSKKDAALRHSELLSYVSPTLLLWVSTNCRKLMSERESQLLVLSAVKHCTGDVTELMQNIAQVVAEPFQPGSHIVDDTGGHLVLKRLILNDTERIKAGQTVLFSTILLNTVPADRLHSWTSCNRGCFMLVSLMEVGDATVTERLNKCLKTVKEKLQQEQHKLKGAQVLLSKLTGQVTVNSDCRKNVKTVKMDVDS
jgi:pumilio family protein 6